MPQLDSLRAISVFLVLLEHWIPEGTGFKIIPFGMIGVTIFFVLSGFLITEILLKSRNTSEKNNTGIIHSLKNFYVRRTLRIFPVYYLTILILFILNINDIREIIIWFITYTSNIYFYSIHSWVGSISHMWTLAVEEQFYIFWPLLILLIPKKYILPSISGVIVFSIIFRAVMFYFSDKSENSFDFISILTPSCMDSFGFGAILAFYRNKNPEFKFSSMKAKLFLSANILLIIVMLQLQENLLNASNFRFSVSVAAVFLISKLSIGFTGFMKLIFENKVLMYLGKISYGMYLFHMLIPMLYNYLKLPKSSYLLVQFFCYTALLITVASLSWFLLEKPINNLKKYFSYS